MANSKQMVHPVTGGEGKALQRLIEETRRRLVETGTRNRLVHVNRANTRGNVLNIVNERSDDVYSILSARKTMRFRATGQDHEDLGQTLRLADTHEGTYEAGHYTDAELETRLGPDALQKKLLKSPSGDFIRDYRAFVT